MYSIQLIQLIQYSFVVKIGYVIAFNLYKSLKFGTLYQKLAKDEEDYFKKNGLKLWNKDIA